MKRWKPASRLILKLLPGTSRSAGESVRSAALRGGATSVHALFPDSREDDLAALWVLEVDTATAAQRLLVELAKLDAVEYVEPEARRRLSKK